LAHHWTVGEHFPKSRPLLVRILGGEGGDTFLSTQLALTTALGRCFGSPAAIRMHLTERYRRLNHDTLELQISWTTQGVHKDLGKSPQTPPSWSQCGNCEWFCRQDDENAYGDAVRNPLASRRPPSSLPDLLLREVRTTQGYSLTSWRGR